jgi:tRNA(fMet)-specific endonuclease VapC
MYILDTDHVSLLQRKVGAEAERLRFRLASVSNITTIITFEEQMRGWLAWLAQARSLQQQVERYYHLKRMLTAFAEITVLDFDERAAEEFQRLQKLRIRIGTMDKKIAAITLVHKAILLSRNLKDFGKVPGLKVEDWSI